MPKPMPALLMLRDPTTGRSKLVRCAKNCAKRVRKTPEQLEPRTMLTASPLQFGAVYVEQDLGSDAHPDTIEISFVGGAADTQLTKIEINGDKLTPGMSFADMIFDTVDTGLGVDLPFDGIIASREGDFGVEIFVEDGSSLITLQFEDFDAGEKVTLAVDVDEVQGFDETETDLELTNEDLDPIASGAEFQGTQLTAYFSTPHFHDIDGTAEFRNRYDKNLEPTELDLPLDDEGENRDRTAGAVGEATQTPLPISISGRVYEDKDANLNQDDGDEGLVGVELALFIEQDGEYVFTGHTVVTNSVGEYSFDTELGLLPGTYQLREAQPENYVSVGAEIGSVAGEATGSIQTSDILTSISIPFGGTQATEYNFAETRLASIGGRVQLSSPDGDCWEDSEQHDPVVGATILLLDADGKTIDETTTDENGNYEFFDLWPGEYSLVEVTPDNLFEGGARAGDIDGETRGTASTRRIAAVSLFSGDEGESFDFCDHPPAKLGGSVYHDRDNNGLQDVGEEGIANAILSLLDEDGLVVDTTETDENGNYEFVGLRAGNYRVIELQPNGWLDGKDRTGTANGRATGRAINPGDEIEAISLLWGDEGIDFDFGELLPSSIEGRVHLSTRDGDCWDIDESLLEPVAGAVVQLLDATGQVLAETTTAEDGTYFFDELVPGEYSIRQITPEDLVDGGSQAGTVDGDPLGEVNGAGDIVGVTLNSDQAGTDYDFCEHKPSTISGFVFEDANNDGIRDPGEAPIEGVIIQLFDEEGTLIAETTTDENGQYTFEGLPPGNYSLRQIQPEDYLDGLDSVGTIDGEKRGRALNPGDQLIDIQVGWGETGLDYNFGELRAASLSGHVHSSSETNCWEDEDATPLAGVRITLLGENGRIVAETVTDAAGQYSFDGLAPGEYHVVQEQPAGTFDGAQRAGSSGGDATQSNQIVGVDLSSGTQATNYDFCEKPPATISGFVFVDGQPIGLKSDETLPQDVSTLRDGKLTEDDQRLAGVRLQLRNGITGEAIDAADALAGYYADGPIQTLTNVDGYYEFAGLPNGNYAVYELHPDGYFDGIDTPGTTDGIAINPLPFDEDDIFLETVISGLVVPPANDAIVRIGLPTGAHSELNNFSEVLTLAIPDPPPPPVVPPVAPPPITPPVPPAPPEPPRLTPPIDPPPTRPIPPSVGPDEIDLYSRARDLADNPLVDDAYINDGSHGAIASTWHLSIIDGGQPRVSHEQPDIQLLFPVSIWKQDRLANARWEITFEDGEEESHYFGLANSLPITGDFNGDGSTEIGVYRDGHWFIDLNGNGRWDAKDLWAKLGHNGDLPVVGDWDGDGKDDIGIFGRAWPGDSIAIRQEHGLPDMENIPDGAKKNMPPEENEEVIGRRVMKHTARGELREDVIDHVFLYGTAGDVGVVGDWNGDGIDTVGVFRSGVWQLDVDGNGRWTDPDESSAFGRVGDIPIVGDFDGDGIDDLAIIRNGKIYIDANGNRELDVNDLVIEFDESKGFPVVGKWGADGSDSIGQFKPYEAGRVTVATNTETE